MQVTDEMVDRLCDALATEDVYREHLRVALEAALADVPDRQPLPGPGARPETLEACWAVIEMMDVEVLGAMNDLDAAKTRVIELEAQLAKVPPNGQLADLVKANAEVGMLNVELQVGLKVLTEKWRAMAQGELEGPGGDPAVALARKLCAADLEALSASVINPGSPARSCAAPDRRTRA